MLSKISKYLPKTIFEKLLFIAFYTKVLIFILPIEFINYNFREDFRIYHSLVVIGLCIIWAFIKIIKARFEKNPVGNMFIKTIITIFFSFFSCIFLFFMLFAHCQDDTGFQLYKQKKGNASIELITLNCGATTGYDKGDFRYYYIKPLTPYFNFVWKTDTTSLDKRDWERYHIK